MWAQRKKDDKEETEEEMLSEPSFRDKKVNQKWWEKKRQKKKIFCRLHKLSALSFLTIFWCGDREIGRPGGGQVLSYQPETMHLNGRREMVRP